jgi:hypothetical protein
LFDEFAGHPVDLGDDIELRHCLPYFR